MTWASCRKQASTKSDCNQGCQSPSPNFFELATPVIANCEVRDCNEERPAISNVPARLPALGALRNHHCSGRGKGTAFSWCNNLSSTCKSLPRKKMYIH